MQAEGEFAKIKQNLEPAIKLSGQPVKRGTMAHEHIVYMMLVDNAEKARDRETIQKYAPLLEKLAARDEHKPYLGVAQRAKGVANILANQPKKAEAPLKEALEIFQAGNFRWQLGRTYMALADLAALKKNGKGPQEYYQLALEQFEALGAEADIQRVRAKLEEQLP